MRTRLTTHIILSIVLPVCFAKAETVAFNAVDDNDVNHAQCRYHQGHAHSYREEIIRKYAEADPEGREAEFEVNGIRFKNESPALVFRFMQLTTPVDISKNHTTPDLTRSKIPSDCSKVRCALDAIFGPERAEKMLFLLIAYEVNTSPYRYANADIPNEQELDTFIDAFDLTPPFLTQIELDKKMIRFKRGYVRKGQDASVMANSTMEFYDTWSEHTPQTRTYAIIHEFAHHWAKTRTGPWDESPEWLKATGWRRLGNKPDDKWSAEEVRGLVSSYSRKSPKEDFAESAAAYRFAPERLRRLSSERYEFMKNIIFAGIEFDREKPNCAPANELLNQVQEKFDQVAISEKELEARLPQFMPQCQPELVAMHANSLSRHKLRQCLEGELMRLILTETRGPSPSLIPRYLTTPLTLGTRAISDKAFNQAIAFGDRALKSYCDLKTTGGDFRKDAIENRIRRERGLDASEDSARPALEIERLQIEIILLRVALFKICKIDK